MYFVSHCWNTPFSEFVETIRCHAEAVAGESWRSQTYWVCSFSNNQWGIIIALGETVLESAFRHVLRGGVARDMVMVLDPGVLPLQRVCCSLELWIATYQKLSVAFATVSGIIGDARSCSVDVVFGIAQIIKTLRVEDYGVSSADDKRNILACIVNDLGSLEPMDEHIKHIMAMAIRTVTQHVNAKSPASSRSSTEGCSRQRARSASFRSATPGPALTRRRLLRCPPDAVPALGPSGMPQRRSGFARCATAPARGQGVVEGDAAELSDGSPFVRVVV